MKISASRSHSSMQWLTAFVAITSLALACSDPNPDESPSNSGGVGGSTSGNTGGSNVAGRGNSETGGAESGGSTNGSGASAGSGGNETSSGGSAGDDASGGAGPAAGSGNISGRGGNAGAGGIGEIKPCVWKSPDGDSLAGKHASYFPIGAAVRSWNLENQSAILTQDFNHLTAENAMKMQDIHPAENTFNWAEADRIANFARTHCMKMTGHALLWHRQAPAWMFQGIVAKNAASLEKLKARLKSHIEALVNRYGDVVSNWDVVNEAISDTEGKTYRDAGEGSKWFELFGSEEYIYWAFLYARDALEARQPGSSKGKLYYNEYVVTKKADKILKMLAWLKSKGIVVDGVGFQAHEQLTWPSVSDLQTAFDKFKTAGYKVKISELDVSVYADYATGEFKPQPEVPFTSQLETTQAKRYADLFTLYRKNKALITSVSTWGVSDDRTWLDNSPVVGRNDYPLLYNDAHKPKAARRSIVNF